jgi:hypothetical protein
MSTRSSNARRGTRRTWPRSITGRPDRPSVSRHSVAMA